VHDPFILASIMHVPSHSSKMQPAAASRAHRVLRKSSVDGGLFPFLEISKQVFPSRMISRESLTTYVPTFTLLFPFSFVFFPLPPRSYLVYEG
jgi:hypothetical protein